MNKWIHFNGQLTEAGAKLVPAGNRGLRYGDGLFETIKVIEGAIPLAPWHFERLFLGLRTLHINIPPFLTPAYLSENILQLCRQNGNEKAARVRLNIFRGVGTPAKLEEPDPCIVIESESLSENYLQWNEKGLTIDVFPDARKSTDRFANLKSNNYLPYIMAAMYAKEKGLDDCLVLNTHHHICDSTIANVFIVKDGHVITPPLSEGCVAGVMRRFLEEQLRDAGYHLREKAITIEELEEADELFLTNALFGIRWVHQFREKEYMHPLTAELYNRFIKIVYPSELL